MNLQEAAAAADKGTRTLQRWIRSGRLRAQRAGRELIIGEADLRAALRGDDVPPAAERTERALERQARALELLAERVLGVMTRVDLLERLQERLTSLDTVEAQLRAQLAELARQQSIEQARLHSEVRALRAMVERVEQQVAAHRARTEAQPAPPSQRNAAAQAVDGGVG